MRQLILLILFLFSNSLWAETLVLLSIPLNSGEKFNYEIEQPKACSFEGVSAIATPQLELSKDDPTLMDKIVQLQRKINLAIEESEIKKDRITFSIKGAENMSFEFYYNQEECKLVRVLHFNDKEFNMKALQIDYSTFLKSPVLSKITVVSDEAAVQDLYLYPWALRGQMSLYELNLGPAINIHTNIRLNSRNKFEKNNPVVEPIPAFFFRYGPLFLNKNGLGSLLFNYKDFSIIGMGLLEGEPYDGEGMQERHQAVYLGTIFKFNLAELTYYNDFFKDRGYNLKLNLAPEFYYNLSWKFSPQFFVQYWDNRYVDYYFGVAPDEIASSGFKYYKGTHTMNYGTMFEVMHFQDRWTYLVSAGVKVYGKEVFSSPTVSRGKEVRFISSVLFKFF